MNTIRQEIISLLSSGGYGAKSISQILRLSEKDVFEHLFHINRTLKSHNRKLKVIPAQCLECGFVFESRNRFTAPGKCPVCRGEHIQDPEYTVSSEQ
jgi:predicted Zn-ribbon and HTH transcriptional regulator